MAPPRPISLHIVRDATLPRLAWCARLVRGARTATVVCGPWVETREDALVEGVWDGPFALFGFDQALTFTGSGVRTTADGVLFSASSHLVDRLYSVASGDSLYVSNSLVFLLSASGDRPRPNYPFYFHDFAALRWRGISAQPKYVAMDSGRRVRLHDGENFLVSPDLTITRLPRRAHDPPQDFAGYLTVLQSGVRGLFENAAARERTHRFVPITTVSRGYDAPATSVLAQEAGCRRALTFRDATADEPDADNGLEIGRRLGLETAVYERFGFQELPGLPDAEFLAFPNGMDRMMAIVEPELPGALLLTGRHGDLVWTPQQSLILPDYQLPEGRATPELSMIEFRLRVGFLRMPVPYVAGRDPAAIHRLTRSAEMAPWSVGGSYDRPIPRRIAEEGGIPRDWFGRNKRGSAFVPNDSDRMTAAGFRDYSEFVRDQVPPLSSLRRWQLRGLRRISRAADWGAPRLERLLRTCGVGAAIGNPVAPRHRQWPGGLTYAFQYGFDRVRSRYSGERLEKEALLLESRTTGS